ncbi:MAG: SRPBCC family protein [Bacteroidota bacterium]
MKTDKIVQKNISINAQTTRVWDMLTNPDRIREWLYGTNTTTDWKVGSPIRFSGSWDGKEYEDKGRILQFEPEKILEYSYWSGFSGLPDEPENYSIVTFELMPINTGTDLSLTQRNFATAEMCEHSDKNWEQTLKLMKELLEK